MVKISSAEFKSDVWVPGLKNLRRTSRLDANQGVEMTLGEEKGVPATWLAIRVPGQELPSTLVPADSIDFLIPAQPEKTEAKK